MFQATTPNLNLNFKGVRPEHITVEHVNILKSRIGSILSAPKLWSKYFNVFDDKKTNDKIIGIIHTGQIFILKLINQQNYYLFYELYSYIKVIQTPETAGSSKTDSDSYKIAVQIKEFYSEVDREHLSLDDLCVFAQKALEDIICLTLRHIIPAEKYDYLISAVSKNYISKLLTELNKPYGELFVRTPTTPSSTSSIWSSHSFSTQPLGASFSSFGTIPSQESPEDFSKWLIKEWEDDMRASPSLTPETPVYTPFAKLFYDLKSVADADTSHSSRRATTCGM